MRYIYVDQYREILHDARYTKIDMDIYRTISSIQRSVKRNIAQYQGLMDRFKETLHDGMDVRNVVQLTVVLFCLSTVKPVSELR